MMSNFVKTGTFFSCDTAITKLGLARLVTVFIASCVSQSGNFLLRNSLDIQETILVGKGALVIVPSWIA
ncbi:hypothetical protein Gasu2_29620 [Galdieria sulphuraria]|uniref:Uncharacterized protein n=1 Tax=Galdieria sulphuraria TaxID=130081 RepID=M2W3Y6_GALSU|nr:uncharacterized protein Gasu_23520 [Galdieria sulphuraria]EME30451.1 hypothetical protein Gasu_23520 [Galdieria sulphuraria]GJD08673.1 hypothetical protein Gasu2_29620 [Galdieria sulphuraria]|eukprot:XP_005706971.1 hypothetical protein Gasu_23520 [Galdieria sulphuraria]